MNNSDVARWEAYAKEEAAKMMAIIEERKKAGKEELARLIPGHVIDETKTYQELEEEEAIIIPQVEAALKNASAEEREESLRRIKYLYGTIIGEAHARAIKNGISSYDVETPHSRS